MKIPDYHIHTALCKHANGSMEDYVLQAIKFGLDEIAFTDHIPLPDNFDLSHRMHIDEIETYLSEIQRLQKEYLQIKILTGIEADFYDGFENYLDDFLKQYHFDLVIMSVHFIKHWPAPNWVFAYNFPDRELSQIYSDYLEALNRGIQSGLFDIIGHFDLIKSQQQSLLFQNKSQVKVLLQEAKKQNMALEINTSGYRKDIGDPYPSLTFLPLIAETCIPVTIGSDAHAPEQVGYMFTEIEKQLIAFPQIKQARYHSRKLSMHSLTDNKD